MKILYVASDIRLGGTDGGAVHVREVASGLSRLGHEVRAVVKGSTGEARRDRCDGFGITRTLFRVPVRPLRLLALPTVLAEAGRFAPDVIIERYYNFGGEGVIAAGRRRVPAVLEVNSPMIEYPGSPKDRLDRTLGSPMRRWRERLARRAAALVTPSAAVLPPGTPPERIHVLPWGANTDAFHPDVAAADVGLPPERRVLAFVASFRGWHGAERLVEAALRLKGTIAPPPLFLMIGDGPARPAVEQRATALGVGGFFRFFGAVPHERVPSLLRLATIAVAPFDTSRHRYLEIDFYWCPLKILESMAMALPVVTIDVPALREIVRPGSEGLVYPERDVDALVAALRRLLDHPEEARRMGVSARRRAVERYSWRGHCEALDRVLRSTVPLRSSP